MNAPANIPQLIKYVHGMEITTGIYLSMPEEVYFAQHDWVSNSGLKRFAAAPANYRYGDNTTTNSQRFGKVAHCALLEPDELTKRFARTELERSGTKAWDAETAAAGGRELIKADQFDKAVALQGAIKRQGGPLYELIQHEETLKEVSFFWVDPVFGIRCRGRTDGLCIPFGIAFDLKMVAESSSDKFNRSVRDYSYHWQNAFYVGGLAALGVSIKDFLFFPVENEAPFLYRSWSLPQFLIDHARARIYRTLDQFASCVRAEDWPGYDTNIEPLPYPEQWINYYD